MTHASGHFVGIRLSSCRITVSPILIFRYLLCYFTYFLKLDTVYVFTRPSLPKMSKHRLDQMPSMENGYCIIFVTRRIWQCFQRKNDEKVSQGQCFNTIIIGRQYFQSSAIDTGLNLSQKGTYFLKG